MILFELTGVNILELNTFRETSFIPNRYYCNILQQICVKLSRMKFKTRAANF